MHINTLIEETLTKYQDEVLMTLLHIYNILSTTVGCVDLCLVH